MADVVRHDVLMRQMTKKKNGKDELDCIFRSQD